MKRKKKYKIISELLLALAIVFVYCSCGRAEELQAASSKLQVDEGEELQAPSYKFQGDEGDELKAVEPEETVEPEVTAEPVDMWGLEKGDVLIFGSYEQDNELSNGSENIEWLVLERQENRLFLITECGIDCRQYDEDYAAVTWDSCSLRSWLNEEFLNAAFSEEEQLMIEQTAVPAEKNPDYGTSPGSSTVDRIFLLSIQEAEKYFASDEERLCCPTAYASANGAKKNAETNCCWWWLRSPGFSEENAAIVDRSGAVTTMGDLVISAVSAVRPAMWINIE